MKRCTPGRREESHDAAISLLWIVKCCEPGNPAQRVATVRDGGNMTLRLRGHAFPWTVIALCTHETCIAQQLPLARLVAPDGDAADNLGNSVAMLDGIVCAGACFDRIPPRTSTDGSVRVFRNLGGRWSYVQRLINPAPAEVDVFGWALAARDDVLVVSSLADSWGQRGKVHLFRDTGVAFEPTTTLQGSTEVPNDYFGFALAMTAEHLVVSAPTSGVGSTSGRVYVYAEHADTWLEEAILSPPSYLDCELFGLVLAADERTIAIRAQVRATRQPVVVVFEQLGTVWHFSGTIANSQGSMRFGDSLAVDQGSVIIGDPSALGSSGTHGRVCTYTRTQSDWELSNITIAPPDVSSASVFGLGLRVRNNRLYVVEQFRDGGRIHSYERTVEGWHWLRRDEVPTSDVRGALAGSVDGIGDTVVAGAPGAGPGDLDGRGTVWATGLAYDCNADQIADAAQLLDGSLVDMDQNGVPDVCELPCSVTTETASVEFVAAADLVLTVRTARPDSTYEWGRLDGPIPDAPGRVHGQGTPTLRIDDAVLSDQGQYICYVDNSWCGSVSSVPIDLFCWPVVDVPEVNSPITDSSPYTVQAAVESDIPVAFRWLRNGEPIVDGPFFSGSDTPTLTIFPPDLPRPIEALPSGLYVLEATNACGTRFSSWVPIYFSCLADLDYSGQIDGDDVILFFSAWDDGKASADVNQDRAVDGDDVIHFFERWDMGC